MSSESPDLDKRLARIDVADTLEDRRVRARVKERLFGGTDEAVKVDRFVLLDRLGQGAMGAVYSAYDPKLDRRVALKFVRVHGDGRGTEAARRRLVDEARTAAKLSHANVLSVYDVGECGERVYIAMEYVEGGTLAQWMATDRTTQEVVDVFTQAGHGLMAAHTAGIVHRDFKPANVLMGTDSAGRQRVLVADFGLARHVTADTDGRAGTPAYMAPEQHRGDAVGVRADQFGFCVALWEALFGQRPFDDTTRPGKPVPPRSLSKLVPEHLRVACTRGLQGEPDDRYPDMQSLLASIAKDPAARRRRWFMRTLLVGFGAVVAIGTAALTNDKPEVCPVDTSAVVGAWDESRGHEVRAAFDRTGMPYSDTSWRTVKGALDRYSAALVAGRKDACEATHVRKQQSAALLDLRVRCLDTRAAELRSLTDAFVLADKDVVENAVGAVAKLSSLASCSNAAALQRPVQPPSEMVKAQVDLQYRHLARAATLQNLGRYADAGQVAEAVVVAARGLGYPPLLAKALVVRGTVETKRGEHKAARVTLEEAVVVSVAGRDDRTFARATISLVFSVGYWQRNMGEAARWAKLAEASIVALGGDTDAEATLRGYEAAVAGVAGKRDVAETKARQVLALQEARYGPSHVVVGRALGNLGNALHRTKKLEEAETLLLRALSIFRASYGAEHPRVALFLSNLGAVQSRAGRNAEALVTLREALRIKEKTLGLRHPAVARTISHIADVLAFMKRYRDSLTYSKRAIELAAKRLGPTHPMLINYYVNVGLTYVELAEHANVVASAARALEIIGKQKRAAKADARLLGALALRGRGYLAMGRHREALADLERALSLYQPKSHYRDEVGDVRFALARALVASGAQHRRAKSLATAARADYASEKQGAERVRQVDAWLKRFR